MTTDIILTENEIKHLEDMLIEINSFECILDDTNDYASIFAYMINNLTQGNLSKIDRDLKDRKFNYPNEPGYSKFDVHIIFRIYIEELLKKNLLYSKRSN